jgi:hypothetical protein
MDFVAGDAHGSPRRALQCLLGGRPRPVPQTSVGGWRSGSRCRLVRLGTSPPCASSPPSWDATVGGVRRGSRTDAGCRCGEDGWVRRRAPRPWQRRVALVCGRLRSERRQHRVSDSGPPASCTGIPGLQGVGEPPLAQEQHLGQSSDVVADVRHLHSPRANAARAAWGRMPGLLGSLCSGFLAHDRP